MHISSWQAWAFSIIALLRSYCFPVAGIFACCSWNCSEQPFNFPTPQSIALVKVNKARPQKSPNWVPPFRCINPNPGTCPHTESCQPALKQSECWYVAEAELKILVQNLKFRGQGRRTALWTVFLESTGTNRAVIPTSFYISTPC